ncbi:MAG TPA: sigma 54-interacting transcriptional regulator, partial [Polyangiaceae bacterium]
MTSRYELAVLTLDGIRVIELPASGSLSIGREDGNDVKLDDASVSRRHARLHLGPPLRLEDLGGSNGTSLRDPRESVESGATENVRQLAGESAELAPGDWMGFGAITAVVRRVVEQPDASDKEERIVVDDPAMRELHEQLARAAESQISVLLLGETGVGKEVVAQALHRLSPRARGPFVTLNCAALLDSVLESELFGHERGSFTGALQARPGLFEAASGGSIFLDEVGELSPSVQPKLLRVLEERKVLRVGARTPRDVDVRVIAATNRDLDEAVSAGTFREDLYFRLNTMTLVIPPLRERRSELAPLARLFLRRACLQVERAAPDLSPATLQVFERYAWPGNVRELRNAIERAVVLCRGALIEPDHLPHKLRDAAGGAPRR